MFTGLVQGVGTVAGLSPTSAGLRLSIQPGAWPGRPGAGASVAVSGVCLTVVTAPGANGALSFDIVPETLRRTTLGDLRAGDRVNLEGSLRAGQELGGHFVQGHVDGVGEVLRVGEEHGEHRVRVRAPGPMLPLLAPKGSIAMEGVSLTIAEVAEDWFEVALIPTTLRETTLGALTSGSRVNLESDMIARSVLRALQALRERDAGQSASAWARVDRDGDTMPRL